MLLSRLNLALAIGLGSVVALICLMRVDNSRPNFQVNLGDDMTYSPAYHAFEANRNFQNGRTLQAPVVGSVARGTQLFHFQPTPQDAIRAGQRLQNPFDLAAPNGRAAAGRGQVVFQTFCNPCHGSDGSGNGLVAQRGFPPPPSLLTGKSRQIKDGQLFHILTMGQGSMPEFAAQLSPRRRWEVIAYLRQLQQAVEVPAPPDEVTGGVAESPADSRAHDRLGKRP